MDMYYGELVKLRAIELSDLDNIMQSWNRWELRHRHGMPVPKSRAAIKEWLQNATTLNVWKDGQMILAVTDKKTDQFLGVTRLYDIRQPHNRASLGISIQDAKNQGKGYGTDTTIVMLWVGFTVLGLHSIYLDTMEDNHRAIHTAEKVGFKRIGVFRETEFIAGEYKGLVYMDILKREFDKLHGKKVDAFNLSGKS